MFKFKRAYHIENHFSGYIDGLADAVEQGLVKAVGVCNYNGIFLESKDTYIQ